MNKVQILTVANIDAKIIFFGNDEAKRAEKTSIFREKWSCRDSNPGPDKAHMSFLHA